MKASVALATYNGSAFLEEQLASIWKQTRPIDELFLSDDGSVDSTLAIAHQFASMLPDPRPQVVIRQNDHNLGVAQNFEKAIQGCSGEVIFLCDQDDCWHADKVARVMDEFERRPDLLLLYSDAQLIDEDREPLGATQFMALDVTRNELDLVHAGRCFEVLLGRNLVTGATVALRRELLALAQPFPQNWVHDEWLAAVASAVGIIDVIEDCLIDYRQHSGNQIGMQHKSRLKRLAEVFSARGTFYEHEATRAETLLAHLSRLGPRVSSDKLQRLSERIAHLRFRASLPRARLARILPITGEAMSGGYSRYGRGLRSILRDLIETL